MPRSYQRRPQSSANISLYNIVKLFTAAAAKSNVDIRVMFVKNISSAPESVVICRYLFDNGKGREWRLFA